MARQITAGATDNEAFSRIDKTSLFFTMMCGACHPGGGSGEFDRDGNPYVTYNGATAAWEFSAARGDAASYYMDPLAGIASGVSGDYAFVNPGARGGPLGPDRRRRGRLPHVPPAGVQLGQPDGDAGRRAGVDGRFRRPRLRVGGRGGSGIRRRDLPASAPGEDAPGDGGDDRISRGRRQRLPADRQGRAGRQLPRLPHHARPAQGGPVLGDGHRRPQVGRTDLSLLPSGGDRPSDREGEHHGGHRARRPRRYDTRVPGVSRGRRRGAEPGVRPRGVPRDPFQQALLQRLPHPVSPGFGPFDGDGGSRPGPRLHHGRQRDRAPGHEVPLQQSGGPGGAGGGCSVSGAGGRWKDGAVWLVVLVLLALRPWIRGTGARVEK